MTDMLVKLYDLENDWRFIAEQAAAGITIRKPLAAERPVVLDWIGKHFNATWSSETAVTMTCHPFSCFIALDQEQLIGFGCYDAAALGFFGPLGVLESQRGKDVGKALLLSCLLDMKLKGYGYAIIGWVGPAAFYENTVNAVAIPDSRPGIWKGWLQTNEARATGESS